MRTLDDTLHFNCSLEKLQIGTSSRVLVLFYVSILRRRRIIVQKACPSEGRSFCVRKIFFVLKLFAEYYHSTLV